MPHLVIVCSGNLETRSDLGVLCRSLADTMLAQRDDDGKPVFPRGGTRVFAYPAPYYAIGDGGAAGRADGGSGEYFFAHLLLRMGRGRSERTQQRVGHALEAATRVHFQPLLDTLHIGVTIQIDVGTEVFDSRLSSLHALFKKKT